LIVFNPELSGPRKFVQRIESLISSILDQEGTRLPGDKKQVARRKAVVDGIEIPLHLLEEIRALI